MATKIVGIGLLSFGFYLFKMGVKWKDTGHGKYISNVRLIGSSVLIIILGISFVFTSKSICEILGIFC